MTMNLRFFLIIW